MCDSYTTDYTRDLYFIIMELMLQIVFAACVYRTCSVLLIWLISLDIMSSSLLINTLKGVFPPIFFKRSVM